MSVIAATCVEKHAIWRECHFQELYLFAIAREYAHLSLSTFKSSRDTRKHLRFSDRDSARQAGKLRGTLDVQRDLWPVTNEFQRRWRLLLHGGRASIAG
jgi:hypothetical protein